MEQPLISVIVPVYNVEPYLNKCVESIVNQTYKKIEIILVDDGSSDNCPRMCDEWAKKESRIKVVHKENGGLSDARNAGIRIATGELIGFVDSDDLIASEMYQLLFENMQQNDSDISACGIELVWEDGTKPRTLTISGSCVMDTEEAMQAIIEESWIKQPVVYKLYKRKLIESIPFETGKYHEDVFWGYRVVGQARRVSVFDIPCYYYLQHNGSIMNEQYSLKRLDELEARKQQKEYVGSAFPNLLPLAKRSLYFSCMYQYQQILKYLSGDEKQAAIKMVKQIFSENRLTAQDRKLLPFKQKIWAMMADFSLELACRIRNKIGVGL